MVNRKVSLRRRGWKRNSPEIETEVKFSQPGTLKRRTYFSAIALLPAAALITAGIYAIEKGPAERTKRDESYLVKVTEKKMVLPEKKKPKTTPPPKPKPKPKPKPEPKPKPKPKIVKADKKPEPRTHKSAKKPPKPGEEPKEVFGVSKNSVSDKGSGKASPIGNTLMKEPEKEFTPPEKVKSLYRMREVTTRPKLVSFSKPAYTLKALARRIEGVVKLKIVVGKNGRVQSVSVVRKLGGGLDEKTVRAIKRARFSPAVYNGQKVACQMIVPIRFKIN